MSKRLLLFLAVFLLIALPAYAGFQPRHWQYGKDISVETDGFVLIDLDKEILNHTRFDLQDLRLVRQNGEEIPFQVVRHEPVKENIHSVRLIDSTYQKDFSYVTLVIQKENSLYNQLLLNINNTDDYLRNVIVEGSNDNKNWAIITEAKIAHFSSDFRQNSISYKPVSFKYLRLQIENKDNKPLDISGASVKFIPAQNISEEKQLPLKLVSVKTGKETKMTEITVDLEAKGYYVGNIMLEYSGQNFHRNVRYYHGDGNKWTEIGSDIIYEYKWKDYTSIKNTVEINQYCERYIKLAIENQDNQPLVIKGVRAYGDSPKLLAELPSGTHILWYGSADAVRPDYDLSRFAHLIDKSGLTLVNPGPEKVNDGYSPAVSPAQYRWILNIITVICAAVIGFLILKNMKSKAQ